MKTIENYMRVVSMYVGDVNDHENGGVGQRWPTPNS